jgi:hypothetical protein
MEKEAMQVEVCSDAASATGRLDGAKFEAVVLDFNRRTEALEVLKTIRLRKSHKGVVVIVILNDNDGMPEAFRAGTSFVLVRPLSNVAMTRTLRASYPLMVRERSRYFRCPLQTPAYISIASRPELMVTCANISEAGMAITNAPSLMPGDKVVLRLTLPGNQTVTKVSAVVCWCDDAGRAGMEFVYVSPPIKEELVSWLADSLAKTVSEKTMPSA